MGLNWLGGALSAVGSIASGLFGQSSADKANAAQAVMAQQQHAWNVEDYQHRYQWAANDMRAAGLNPILAATNGIGGSINGTSIPSAHAANMPDLGSVLSSAYQTGTQKEIAKMQNSVAKDELRLKELDINSVVAKRSADIARENILADVTKWSVEEQNKRAWKKVDAEIENMKETLRITEEHYQRADSAAFVSAEAHMISANAAWHSSEVQAKLADIAEKTGYTQQQLNQAHEMLVKIQTADAEELKEWHEWLNDHKELRGAVGLVGSMWDTYSTAKKVQIMSNAVD